MGGVFRAPNINIINFGLISLIMLIVMTRAAVKDIALIERLIVAHIEMRRIGHSHRIIGLKHP